MNVEDNNTISELTTFPTMENLNAKIKIYHGPIWKLKVHGIVIPVPNEHLSSNVKKTTVLRNFISLNSGEGCGLLRMRQELNFAL